MTTQRPTSLRRVSLIALLACGCIAAAAAWGQSAAAPGSAPGEDPAGRGAMLPAANAGGQREQRFALVIGNSNYREAPLVNPANDARAMSIKLKELGFTVIEKENANLEEMRKLVRDFGNQLQLGDVGLFYYAGHGIQSGNVNYLIPVDADIQDETELASRAFTATEVQEKMEAAKNRVNIVILDACRNNPLARKVRSAGRGLAAMEEGSGMIVEFATSPGSTSADGEGTNGLYTEEILDALSEPGLSVEEVFKRVRMGVSQKSGGEQIPWEHSSLLGDFYFNPTSEQRSRLGPATALVRSASIGGGGGRSREFMPVLVPRRLLENYELNANVALSAPILVGEFTPDSHRFVMVTQDRQLKVLDVTNGNVVFTHAGFDAPSLSADGRYVVGVSDEHLVNVLDTTADSVAVKTYRAAPDVQNAYMSPNGQRVVAVSRTGTVSVIKMETDTVTGPPLKLEGEPTVQFAPAVNRAAVTTSRNGELDLIDLDTGKRIGRSTSHHKPIQLVRFSHDGALLLTAADGDAAYVWRTTDGSKLARLNIGEENSLPGQAEFMDDGKRVLLDVAISEQKGAGTHYRLGTWDVTSGKALATLMPDAQLSDLRFSVDRQQLYATATDHSIRVIDLNTATLRTTLSGADLIGFSSDGSRLLVREGDGIRLYDARNLTPIARMPNQVGAFIAPKSNASFATAATDGSLRLWDFEHGNPGSLLTGHLDTVSRVAFAGGGKQLVSFSKERIAKIWALPEVQDVDKLHKDTYESTIEYQKRVAEWSSTFHTLVTLGDYNADAETYAVKVGDYAFAVPVPRDNARLFAGQREAVLSGRLKVFDGEQLQLGESKLERVP